MQKILLLSMPFASVLLPTVGVSLLKAILREAGISCEIKYPNLALAEMIGLDRYERICGSQGGNLLIGERLFAGDYFSEKLPDEAGYLDCFRRSEGRSNLLLGDFLAAKGAINPFLIRCMEDIRWEEYDIVGFSTMFEQNMSSVALARRIKLLHPAKPIVFGGANCEGEMGAELMKCFPEIDYVCSGEADIGFPELVKRIRRGESVGDVPGIVYRRSGALIANPPEAIEDLGSLPYPDYNDYFGRLEHASFSPPVCVELPMETSRGCWWGEKSQCTFCGQNGASIHFRSKDKDRVIEELYYLSGQHVGKYKGSRVVQISMVDNILDMNYFKEVIPEIGRLGLPVPLFWETKANLNRRQVRLLSEAGVTHIQPGVESLSTNLLRLMKKGVTALQNIQLLKYCRQFGILPDWGIMTGFPGEEIADYELLIELIYKVTHLPPPGAHFPFVLQRFSPYFNDPAKYGLVEVRPEEAYSWVYPFDVASISRLAYNFRFDYREKVLPRDCYERLAKAVDHWQQSHDGDATLRCVRISASSLLLDDRRPNAVARRVVLTASRKGIYEYCDQIRSMAEIFSFIRSKFETEPVRPRDIRAFLDEMVSFDLMVCEGDMYLSLAISHQTGGHGQEGSIRKRFQQKQED